MLRKYLKYPYWGSDPVKLVVFTDVDGCLTDNTVSYDGFNHNRRFSVSDGHGIRLLRENGAITFFLSGENDTSISQRAQKLNVFFIPTIDKLSTVKMVMGDLEIPWAAFGNDIMDIPMLEAANFAGVPYDAHVDTLAALNRENAVLVEEDGGKGAFRSFADWLLKQDWVKKM